MSETQNLICDDILKLSNELPELFPVLAPGPEPHAPGDTVLATEGEWRHSEFTLEAKLSSLYPISMTTKKPAE